MKLTKGVYENIISQDIEDSIEEAKQQNVFAYKKLTHKRVQR
jgi:hypothetical protein